MLKHKFRRSEGFFTSQYASHLKAIVLIILCVIVFPSATFAQEINIKGIVMDKNLGEPIIGASIFAEGNTGIGTITDLDGNFSLKVPKIKHYL